MRAPRCDGVSPASCSSHRPVPDLLQGEARKTACAGVVRAKGKGNGAEEGREEVHLQRDRVCWQGINAPFTLLQHLHKSARIFNAYSPGRDKTSLGDKKATGTRTQKYKQPQTRRAASALLIPILFHSQSFVPLFQLRSGPQP